MFRLSLIHIWQALSAFCVVKVVSDEITIAEGFQLLPGKDFSQYVDNLRIVVAFLLTDVYKRQVRKTSIIIF